MQHDVNTHTIDVQSGICLHEGCDSRNKSETQLDRIERQVSELHFLVMGLLDGAKNAQQSGGMAGMMARQMFPDLSTIVPTPVTQAAPGQNGV